MKIFKKRIILHFDMDAFFASIEIAKNPSLRGKPVIIGGPFEKRGVVSTCSYEARIYGVSSGMPLVTAKRLCPNGIFIPGNYSVYRSISDTIFSLLPPFSEKIEITSIDEGYLEITGSSNPETIGVGIKKVIYETTKLTASVGIGPSKMIAKMASSQNKPNGFLMIGDDEVPRFLSPLPIGAIPGIGKVTKDEMHRLGIKTIKDLKERSLHELLHLFGARGYGFYKEARGIDNRKVEEASSPKSIGAETTFDVDIEDITLLQEELNNLVIKAHQRMKVRNLRTRGLTLKIRYYNFQTLTRSTTFKSYTSDREALMYEAHSLLTTVYLGRSPLRLLGVTFDKLNDGWWQPTLFD